MEFYTSVAIYLAVGVLVSLVVEYSGFADWCVKKIEEALPYTIDSSMRFWAVLGSGLFWPMTLINLVKYLSGGRGK